MTAQSVSEAAATVREAIDVAAECLEHGPGERVQIEKERVERHATLARIVERAERAASLEATLGEVTKERDHLYDQEWPWEWVIASREKKRREAAEARAASLRDALDQTWVWVDDKTSDFNAEERLLMIRAVIYDSVHPAGSEGET